MCDYNLVLTLEVMKFGFKLLRLMGLLLKCGGGECVWVLVFVYLSVFENNGSHKLAAAEEVIGEKPH
ncbi:hypothetical protein Hanom_Chr16g01465861 [Helianthus anomalus]